MKIDTRGWVIIGIFGLAFSELAMIEFQPALAENKLFFGLAMATWTSGVLLIAAFFFGSSAGSSTKDTTIATMAANAGPSLDPTQPPLKVPQT